MGGGVEGSLQGASFQDPLFSQGAIDKYFSNEGLAAAQEIQGEMRGLPFALPGDDFVRQAVPEGLASEAAILAAAEQQVYRRA